MPCTADKCMAWRWAGPTSGRISCAAPVHSMDKGCCELVGMKAVSLLLPPPLPAPQYRIPQVLNVKRDSDQTITISFYSSQQAGKFMVFMEQFIAKGES